ncbi:MAG: LAGLIDADG family homing endonuclease [bacterium]
MEDKIRILFYNKDGAGVNYYRTLTPAKQLERDHSDNFYVEINPDLNYNDLENTLKYLKSFHIIHYHRSMTGNATTMLQLANELRKAGVVLIADIDDYWELPKQHPFYSISREKKLHLDVMDNLKIADYVTTTTDIFAEEIRKVTGRDNVIVLPNSVDPSWMKQFRNEHTPDENGLIRFTYMAGSSHRGDVEQLNGTFNILGADQLTKEKFKTIIAGWDTEGKTTDIRFNQEFGKELQKRGIWNKDMVKAINKSGGDIDLIPNIPADMKELYRGKVFFKSERPINSEESVYLQYELIFTDNYSIIKDSDYLAWLKKYERDTHPNEGFFARRWTQKANIYAKVLDETDVSLAPLSDNTFNRMKCVVSNTLINTNKGIYKIGDLVNYGGVNNQKIFNENIVHFFQYPNEKTVKLISEHGYEIEGTNTHRIMVNGTWKTLGEFSLGDELEITPFDIETREYQKIHYPLLLSKRVTDDVISKSKNHMIPSITINEDFGRFFGYMLGDGHFSKGYLNITCDKRYSDVVNDVKDLVENMGLVPIVSDRLPDKRCKNSVVKDGFGVEIRIPSKHLASICYNENLRNEKGKIFEIPHFILKSPKTVIREFLRGLFEADGTVSMESVSVSFTTKSEIFAKQIQYLLLGFGIMSKITISFNKKYNRNYYNVRLNRSGCDIFIKEIGFVSSLKNGKLIELTSKKHSNRYEEQKFSTTISKIEHNINDVYDVEVDNIHQYNGNGIINHNSNLKQVECWSRKLPLVCSDIPPYNVDGVHMKNCLLVPVKKRNERDWAKALKKLIVEPNLREDLGNQLYEDFKDKYHLKNVTQKRAEFYESAVFELNKV